ncbi:MAG: cation:proton antiporter [Alphaproteobacteria bacterium]
MEAHVDLTPFALITAVALGMGLVVSKLRQPVIIGYIMAGLVLGPSGLNLFHNTQAVEVLAELGILMLLFLIGMELDLQKFKEVLKVSLAATGIQIAAAVGISGAIGYFLQWPHEKSLLFGFIIAISSTAVAVKLLEDQKLKDTRLGQLSIGILIAQDLAVVPMLLITKSLAENGDGQGFDKNVITTIGFATILLVNLIWFLSQRQKIKLPLRSYIRARPDFAPVIALAFCFGFAALSGLLGFSTAYGAFAAGLIIGNSTTHREALQATMPIQSILLVVFFLSIGLMINVPYIIKNIWVVGGFLVAVILCKTVFNVITLRALGENWQDAYKSGIVLAQVGEFSFILAAAGLTGGTLDKEGYQLAISVIALSLIISPFWLLGLSRIGALASFGKKKQPETVTTIITNDTQTTDALPQPHNEA